MSIICATNLSPESQHAATVAGTLAARLKQPLCLYGVAEHAGSVQEAPVDASGLSARLEGEAVRLRALGITVRIVMPEGGKDEALISDEECQRARWMVVAAEGWPAHALWRRAPLPERLARRACAPLLVVRRSFGLVDWARGRRRLLVLAGMDVSGGEENGPGAFLQALREVGPCDIIATYVCSPAEERERLGIHSPVHVEMLDPVVRRIEAVDPEVSRVLLRDLRERVGSLPGEGSVELHVEPGYSKRSDHLLHVAHERRVDLMVVGTHQRMGLQRLWHGSVSAEVLRQAEQPVVCVPPTYAQPKRASPPRSVLVPVDFSESSVRAIAQARTLVGMGGRVHLLHVHSRRLSDPDWTDHYGVLPEPPAERDEVLRRLWALVPAEDERVRWSVEGVSGTDVAQAVCQAADREGVDLVCVGAEEGHRRGGGGNLGRVLMMRCKRPVLVVPSQQVGREPPEWGGADLHGR
ncbi:universal stress protein [Hyalangium rubrum]|uniref:Universal stress protein n=1 Tax=Hyalangium rubrum TaxID=3103134 RepID=A0ABU5HGV6_9BACT|nr:universal stress protein [Hyalangium sp. s54d21]MDY7231325.1 universal stress protein [Hyalangium sp. s54d21]